MAQFPSGASSPLKNPKNLTAGQEVKLAELLRYNLRVRAYLLKE